MIKATTLTQLQENVQSLEIRMLVLESLMAETEMRLEVERNKLRAFRKIMKPTTGEAHDSPQN